MRQLDLCAHISAPEPTIVLAIPITTETELLALVSSTPLIFSFPFLMYSFSPSQRNIPTIVRLDKIIARSLDPLAIPLDLALSRVLAALGTLAMATAALVGILFIFSMTIVTPFPSSCLALSRCIQP